MKALLSLAPLAGLAGLAACGRSVDMFPVGPGGPGGPDGVNGQVDAGSGDGTVGSTINGRVCLISDARTPTTCADTGADGLTVTLGTAMATTSADGSFTITSVSGTNLVWRVSGTGVQAAAMPASTIAATIPTISSLLYQGMIAQNQATAPAGSGAVIARITMAGVAVSGLIATPSPVADGLTYYDGASPTVWSETSTGSFGVVWVPGLNAGSVQLTLTGSHDATLTGIPIYADTVTFVLADIQ